MKKVILFMVLLGVASQGFGFESDANGVQPEVNKDKGISSSSGSLFSDVECDMTDYTCAKLVLDLGQQEALQHLSSSNQEVSALLSKAVGVYKHYHAEAASLDDAQVISLLAAGQ